MATLRDVARESGCSLGTVSRVLSGEGARVTPQLHQRVMEAVRKLGYSPPAPRVRGPRPRGSSAASKGCLGVVLRYLPDTILESHGYYAPVIDGILREASGRGWGAAFFTESMFALPEAGLRERVDGRCQGLILVAPSAGSGLIKALKARGTPFVVVNGCSQEPEVASYDVDDDAGARMAVRLLHDAGHRKIAYVTAGYEVESSSTRESAYRSEMVRLGLADWIHIQEGAQDALSLSQTASRIASLHHVVRPTALFCWNDDLALHLEQILPTLGLAVPDQISLIGFDGTWERSRSGRRLATIHQPLGVIASSAASDLIASVEEGPLPRKTLFAPWPELGTSVGPPPQ